MRRFARRVYLRVRQVVGTFLPEKVVYIDFEADDEGGLDEVPCWCGETHYPDYWHDPTHGAIDRDIQDWVSEGFPGISLATRVAIETTAQRRRDEGLQP